MSGAWPWLALAGLGMFHGINPAMGWLFAVALGMYRASRAAVLVALLPIALGHALAVGLVVSLVVALGGMVDLAFLRVAGGLALVGWGVYEWTGLAFLRRAWINLDLLWIAALIGTGCLVLAVGALAT